MKNGYDQFFKNARKAADHSPKVKMKAAANSGANTSTKQVAEDLRARMKTKAPAKNKKSIPWKLVGVSFIGLLLTFTGLEYSEQIEKYVKKIEISFLGSAHAEEAPKAAPAGDKAAAGTAPTEEQRDPAATKKEYTPEEINHFSKLNSRLKELEAREEELTRMEAELATQKQEMEKRLTELEKTRKDISSILEERVQADDKKVETLVQMYSNMKPQQAAKVFETMDEDLAVEIIGRMKKKNAAEVMNLIKPEKAQLFSEKFAGYKRTTTGNSN